MLFKTTEKDLGIVIKDWIFLLKTTLKTLALTDPAISSLLSSGSAIRIGQHSKYSIIIFHWRTCGENKVVITKILGKAGSLAFISGALNLLLRGTLREHSNCSPPVWGLLHFVLNFFSDSIIYSIVCEQAAHEAFEIHSTVFQFSFLLNLVAYVFSWHITSFREKNMFLCWYTNPFWILLYSSTLRI